MEFLCLRADTAEPVVVCLVTHEQSAILHHYTTDARHHRSAQFRSNGGAALLSARQPVTVNVAELVAKAIRSVALRPSVRLSELMIGSSNPHLFVVLVHICTMLGRTERSISTDAVPLGR